MSLRSKGANLLGLVWDFEEDTINLDLAAIAKRARSLTTTKRNTLKSSGDHRTNNNLEDFVSRNVSRQNRSRQPTTQIDKECS